MEFVLLNALVILSQTSHLEFARVHAHNSRLYTVLQATNASPDVLVAYMLTIELVPV